MAEVLRRDPAGLELRADPAALAPERLLVFEVKGSIGQFAAAIQRVPGLELIDEEELIGDAADKSPVAYLLLPDLAALRQLESLWRRWQRDELAVGETPWRDVFALLRDLRLWGPMDRVRNEEADILAEEISDLPDDRMIRLEIELVYRRNPATSLEREGEVRTSIAKHAGRVLARSRIEDIAYHALLAELPVEAVKKIITRAPDGIASLEPIMHIRPQSVASAVEIADREDIDEAGRPRPLSDPILALLDGVPVSAHRLLVDYLVVDDQFGLVDGAPVADRVHGTAMASLIVHGDRNKPEPPLPRRIHVVPVMGSQDKFPTDQLIVDLIYRAVLAMREGAAATARHVLIINISLGNPRRPFHGQMSAWARLLDRLAYRFGILFIVSAGNCRDPFGVPAYKTSTALEGAPADARAAEILRALNVLVGDRRLISPAETVNGITVGAYNEDWVSAADRVMARAVVDPYGALRMANPSSALGPGFAHGVKPDILMPGSREHLRLVRSHVHIDVKPSKPSRAAGLKVAAPPQAGRENIDGFTSGTSAAAALASRTAHRIHDALEATYGDVFSNLTTLERAVLLKALLVHPAKWPPPTATLIRSTIGPTNARQHVQQKDNIRRFLGFGCVDGDDAVACAADRATFWAVGTLEADKIVVVDVPIPSVIGGKARPHAVSATLAWFAPTSPGRKSYRAVRLKLLEPDALESLRVKAHSDQPDSNQTNRGTLFTRCWSGDKAPDLMDILYQRD